ncbi:MAG TPA: FecR domain-containing protein [Chryseosolibacter sp.]
MIRHFAGETTPAEDNLLVEWRKQATQNEAEYQSSKKLFDAATRHYKKSIVPDIDVENEWKIFLKKADHQKTVRQLNPPSAFSGLLRIAATVLLLMVSGALIYYYATKQDRLVFHTEANIETVTLPDGSTIILNRNSRIEYDSDFGDDNRSIALQGEAFFNVKKNSALPFVISARSTTIEVVGTSFNVLAYDSVAEVEVIVKTGVVRFTVPKLNKSIELTPGEKGAFASNNDALDESINDNPNYESWNTRKLVFDETHIAEVIEAINKAYNTNVVLTGTVSDSCLLTVSFDNQSLDAVLNVLENTLNLNYRRVGNRIEIMSAGC